MDEENESSFRAVTAGGRDEDVVLRELFCPLDAHRDWLTTRLTSSRTGSEKNRRAIVFEQSSNRKTRTP